MSSRTSLPGLFVLFLICRRRFRSINKLIRVGRNEVAMVLRVDKEKGYIDLSKRRVSPEDVTKCEEKYNKSKAVHSVMRHVADMQQMALEDLYVSVGWPLYKKYGHAYDAFKLCLAEEVDIFEGLNMDSVTKNALQTYIKRRLAPQPVKIRADVEVMCYTYEGVNAIKEALMTGIACGTKDMPVSIKLIAPPRYVMDTMTLDRDAGKAMLEKAIEVVTEKITSLGGKIEVKMAPKAVSQREETELAAMMERLALENEERDGDTPEDV
jgi:translation initiation factor 2 subunit 1